MKKVALYIRVSTSHQVDKDSLPHQRKELKNYCKHILHLDNLEIFEDAGKSGKNTDRPAFQRMMNKIENDQISHVIVYKIDRISRNLVDFSLMYDKFKKHRVTFVSLSEQFDTSSAIGEAVLKIILVFAELERKLTSERVSDIMLDRASAGLWNGANIPLGYRWDEATKFPVPDDVERKTVELIYNMYDECHSSTIITRYLNDNSIPTKRKGQWTTKTVADIIRNPFYKGTYRYNYRESPHGKIRPQEEWIVKDNNHEPLISTEQWERCNMRMDKNAVGKNLPGFEPIKKHTHVFAGICTCGLCGSNMLAGKDTKRADGYHPSVYRCASRFRNTTCTGKAASEVKLGPFIFNYLKNMIQANTTLRNTINSEQDLERILLTGDEFKNVVGIDNLSETYNLIRRRKTKVNLAVEHKQSLLTETSDKLSENKKEVDKLNRALERLKKAYLFDDDAISEKEYLSTKKDLEVKLVSLNNKIAELEESLFVSDQDESVFMSTASNFLIANKINADGYINYKELAMTIDNNILKSFIRTSIEDIKILDSMPSEIKFCNGMVHKFIYK